MDSASNEELIQRAQRAYLWNIWLSIDNSEIEDEPEQIRRTVHINSTQCRRCGRAQGLVGKYDIQLCRQCFREIASQIGFKRYR